jgi:hypothetical protein
MKPECSRVMDSLGGPLPADLASHVATCETCQGLVGGFDALGGVSAAPAVPPAPRLDAARQRALEELAAHPRPRPWWHELGVLLAVYSVVLGGGLFILGRMVGNRASPAVVATVGVLTLVLVGGGAFVALAPAWRRLPWALVALAVVTVGAAQVLGGAGRNHGPLLEGLMFCTVTEVVLSVPPLATALVLLCRTAFQPVRAMAAGLSAAGVALLVLHLRCADGTAPHLLLSHLLPWLLLAVVGVLVRSRLPTRSYAP